MGRMSKEEKRKTILQIYHDTQQVYTEKEIATLSAKAGVNSGTFAEIHQSLIDDGLVDKDKIGGGNFFWSFRAKKDCQLQWHHQSRLEQIEQLKLQHAQAVSQLEDAQRGREESDEQDTPGMSRAQQLERLAQMQSEQAKLEAEWKELQENDPQALADLQQELKLCQEAANRWTDNLWNAKSYLVQKRGMDKKRANQLLGITDDFDYPEDKIPK